MRKTTSMDSQKQMKQNFMKLQRTASSEIQEQSAVSSVLPEMRDGKRLLLQMPSSLPFKAEAPLTKVGKILVKRSGQVIMRIPQGDGSHVDLELNEGIQLSARQCELRYLHVVARCCCRLPHATRRRRPTFSGA